MSKSKKEIRARKDERPKAGVGDYTLFNMNGRWCLSQIRRIQKDRAPDEYRVTVMHYFGWPQKKSKRSKPKKMPYTKAFYVKDSDERVTRYNNKYYYVCRPDTIVLDSNTNLDIIYKLYK